MNEYIRRPVIHMLTNFSSCW